MVLAEQLNRPHAYYVCSPRFDHRGVSEACSGCHYCVGGLATCTVCGASEGELLLSCPMFKLSAEDRQACLDGKVVDLLGWRRNRWRRGYR